MTREEFATNRVAFAIINGSVVYQSEPIPSKEWLINFYGMSEEEFEKTIRGGIFKDRITLCVGSNYDKCEVGSIPDGALLEIVQKHTELFGGKCVIIENGHIPAEVGKRWECRENLGAFSSLNSV